VEFAVGRVAKLWWGEAPERPQRFTSGIGFGQTFGVFDQSAAEQLGICDSIRRCAWSVYPPFGICEAMASDGHGSAVFRRCESGVLSNKLRCSPFQDIPEPRPTKFEP